MCGRGTLHRCGLEKLFRITLSNSHLPELVVSLWTDSKFSFLQKCAQILWCLCSWAASWNANKAVVSFACAEDLIYAFLMLLWLRQMQRAEPVYGLWGGCLSLHLQAEWVNGLCGDFRFSLWCPAGWLLQLWWAYLSLTPESQFLGGLQSSWWRVSLSLTYVSRAVGSFSSLSFLIILDGIKDDDS